MVGHNAAGSVTNTGGKPRPFALSTKRRIIYERILLDWIEARSMVGKKLEQSQ